ncbi:c-type cytochrome [soil metagenome]
MRVQRRAAALGFAAAIWASSLAGVATAVTAEVQEGRVLFENACSSCHGAGGQGTDLGPPVLSSGAAGADFMLSTGRMPLDDPHRQPIRKPPAFNEGEIAQISAYVSSLGDGPDIPDVDVDQGDVALGQELYSLNCAACHSSAGAGGAVGAGLEAPALSRSTPVQVVESMRIGPGAMPVFQEQTLSKHDADSIARFLLYLREVPDPGGLGMRRIGPIAEGAVAWIVGIGLLVLICRFVGEKE